MLRCCQVLQSNNSLSNSLLEDEKIKMIAHLPLQNVFLWEDYNLHFQNLTSQVYQLCKYCTTMENVTIISFHNQIPRNI